MDQNYNSFDNYTIEPAYSDIMSRKECNTNSEVYIERLDQVISLFPLPLIPANMDTISGEEMYKFCSENNYLCFTHRYQDLQHSWMKYAISVGSIHNEKNKIIAAAKIAKFICVDIAHGHSKHMKDTLNYLRNDLNYKGVIIAGNVVTRKAVIDLNDWGADIVKVGIGQGFVCETTTKTGVGMPQIDAIKNCSNEYRATRIYKGPSIPIIADGGIRKPADFCKAMAIIDVIGIMAGSIFAGTDKTPYWQGEGKPCVYRGMASKEARESVGLSDYIEGKTVDIIGKAPGSTEAVFQEYELALQSAMSYVGARTIKEYKEKAKLIRVN